MLFFDPPLLLCIPFQRKFKTCEIYAQACWSPHFTCTEVPTRVWNVNSRYLEHTAAGITTRAARACIFHKLSSRSSFSLPIDHSLYFVPLFSIKFEYHSPVMELRQRICAFMCPIPERNFPVLIRALKAPVYFLVELSLFYCSFPNIGFSVISFTSFVLDIINLHFLLSSQPSLTFCDDSLWTHQKD